jgi:hypothetical protein
MNIELIKITPKIAIDYLQNNIVNRTLSFRKVNQYVDDILNDNWLSNSGEGISFDWNGNLINGQHRLNAIIKANKSVSMYVFTNCDPQSFKYIDTAKSRSAGDVLSIDGVKNSNHTAAIITSYYYLKNKYTGIDAGHRSELKLTNFKILDLYQKNQDFYNSTINYITASCAKFNRIVTSSLLGGVYCMFYEKDPQIAKMFIDELVGYSPKTHNSTILLAEVLLKNKISTKKLPASYLIAYFYKAWNSYRLKKDIKLLKYNPENDSFPEII